ncbi:MAG TPA: metallopeptidase TldD-related protein, partial [bacterium]|nr:metallopeptidase TldD-related protein [bacterium]
TINYAIASANFGEKLNLELPMKQKIKKNTIKMYDEKIENLDLKQFIEFGNRIIKKLNKYIPNSMVSLSFGKSWGDSILINSNNYKFSEKCSMFDFSVSVVITEKKGILDIYDGLASCALINLDKINVIVDNIIRRYEQAKKIAAIKSEKYPVIFNKFSIGLLYTSFLQAMNGKIYQKGISPLSDKLNKKIVDARFSMYDDPHIDYALGSAIVDAEGIQTYKKPLIEDGVFRNFIFDLRSAKLTGNKSTGNAERSISAMPTPSYSNIVVNTGDKPYNEMIAEIDEGLIVEHTIGAGQSNVLAGDFSVNVSLGYWIKKGKIVGRVKDCMIAGNVYDLFNNKINSISKELFIKSSMRTPAICFNDINIAAK